MISDDDIKCIESQSNDVLASWWCTLNKFKWPDGLISPEPSKFISGGRRSKIMSYIEEKISHKATLREWNKERMSDDEFNDFYEGTFNSHWHADQR